MTRPDDQGSELVARLPCSKATRKRMRVFMALNDLRTYDHAINTLLDIAGKRKRI